MTYITGIFRRRISHWLEVQLQQKLKGPPGLSGGPFDRSGVTYRAPASEGRVSSLPLL